jgi:hypothetical protein
MAKICPGKRSSKTDRRFCRILPVFAALAQTQYVTVAEFCRLTEDEARDFLWQRIMASYLPCIGLGWALRGLVTAN